MPKLLCITTASLVLFSLGLPETILANEERNQEQKPSTPTQVNSPPPFREVECSTFDLQPTLQNAICGYIRVPEFHRQPNGRTLELGTVILKSTNVNPAPEPLFIAQGGPGASTIQSFSDFFAYNTPLQSLQETRDIVLIDQRGTKYSPPFLTCPELAAYQRETIARGQENQANETRAWLACRDRLTAQGVNFNAYNSLESADDILVAREVLGYQKINFYGISYGTVLGQFLLREARTQASRLGTTNPIRSVILDGATPLNIYYDRYAANSLSRALKQIFATCESDQVCSRTYPATETVFLEVFNRLNRQPQTLPIQLEAKEPIEVPIDGYTFVDTLYEALYEETASASLPQWIYAAKNGDFVWLEKLITQQINRPLVDSEALYGAVRCSQIDYPQSEFTMTAPFQELEEMNKDLDESFGMLCDRVFANVERLPAYTYSPIFSHVPALIMAGQYDPILPLPFAAKVAENFSNSHLYNYPGTAHGSLFAGVCPVAMVTQFLARPNRAPDDSCLKEMKTTFSYPLIPLADLQLAKITIEELGVESKLPQQWTEIGPGVYADPNTNALESNGIFYFAVFPGLKLEDVPKIGPLERQIPLSLNTSIGKYQWDIYQMEEDNLILWFAWTQKGENTYGISLVVPKERAEATFAKLWLPALENFEIRP